MEVVVVVVGHQPEPARSAASSASQAALLYDCRGHGDGEAVLVVSCLHTHTEREER